MLVIMNAPTTVIRDVMSSSMMSTSFICRLRNTGTSPLSLPAVDILFFVNKEKNQKKDFKRAL